MTSFQHDVLFMVMSFSTSPSWHLAPLWESNWWQWEAIWCTRLNKRSGVRWFEFKFENLSLFPSLLLLLLLSRFSRVRLCATPQMAAHQALPSLGFSRQAHWSGLPFPSPMHETEKGKWSLSVLSDSLWLCEILYLHLGLIFFSKANDNSLRSALSCHASLSCRIIIVVNY